MIWTFSGRYNRQHPIKLSLHDVDRLIRALRLQVITLRVQGGARVDHGAERDLNSLADYLANERDEIRSKL